MDLNLPENHPVNFLRHAVVKARFEPVQAGPKEVNIVQQAKEVTFPITHHYLDSMLAEHIAADLKTVFTEIFDSLETQAFEIAGVTPIDFSDTWKNGPDAVSQLWLKYATDPQWKDRIGTTEHPPAEEAFGKTPFFVYLTAAMVAGDGFYYVSFAAWVRPGIQDESDKHSYTVQESLETIY